MFRVLSFLRRNFQNLRKSPRVADETALAPAVNLGVAEGAGTGVDRALMNLLPISIVGCFSAPRVSRSDGLWVSGDYARVSEVNQFMVTDGMRYAILM